MALFQARSGRSRREKVLLACGVATLLAIPALMAEGHQGKLQVLRIGTSGTLTPEGGKSKEESSLETLKSFIKEETGFDSEILRQKNWRELVDKMSKAQLELGVFQGYELAWAQEKYPELKPLAIAVNVYRYPVAYVVVQKDNKAKKFADLQGQSLTLVIGGQRFLKLFLEHECEAAGKKLDSFFSKITSQDNIEDALDDVVDGVVQVTVADRAALEAFKRRKPGRFNKLKEVAKSQPFPPPVVSYYGTTLDSATLNRFKQGLLGAARKEKGETMLTLFRLTGFEDVPPDFGKVLAETRKTYPADKYGTN